MDPRDFTPQAPGRLVKSPEGAWAFSPAPLPPDLSPSWPLMEVVSAADRAVAQLAGVAGKLPNPHLLIAPFMRREAVLSSRIEGTQSSFEELLAFEAAGSVPPAGSADVQEVANYVRALEYGLERLKTLPLSLRFIREVHAVLMAGVRGQTRQPGEFRKQQNWIGGGDVQLARFVPPPTPEMTAALDSFERFLHDTSRPLPPLVRLALVHYQFETIHPFLDGNGRLGRLLITLSLCSEQLLPSPLLYLSAFFEREKQTYSDLLLAVSQKGNWEEWIRFFLRGVAEQAKDGVQRSNSVLDLWESLRKRLQAARASGKALALLDELMAFPSVTTTSAATKLHVTFPGAQKVIDRLQAEGVLTEIAATRPRVYIAHDVMQLFRV